MNIINEAAAVWLAMADMELSEQIQQLQQLDEMKNDTGIIWRIKDVLRILSKDATKNNLERLLENIRRSYHGMLHDVRKGSQTPRNWTSCTSYSTKLQLVRAFSCAHCAGVS